MSKDFSTVNGCYTKNLNEHRKLIDTWYADASISLADFVQKVRLLVADAAFNKTAKPRFYAALFKTTTKEAVLTLCYNSILSAKGLAVC